MWMLLSILNLVSYKSVDGYTSRIGGITLWLPFLSLVILNNSFAATNTTAKVWTNAYYSTQDPNVYPTWNSAIAANGQINAQNLAIANSGPSQTCTDSYLGVCAIYDWQNGSDNTLIYIKTQSNYILSCTSTSTGLITTTPYLGYEGASAILGAQCWDSSAQLDTSSCPIPPSCPTPGTILKNINAQCITQTPTNMSNQWGGAIRNLLIRQPHTEAIQ